MSTGPGAGPAQAWGTGRAVRPSLPPGSPRCRLTITLRAPSGTSMHSFSPSSTRHATSMTPSSCEVGGPCGRAPQGPGPGQSLSGQPVILRDKLHPQRGQQSLCELLSSTSVISYHLPSSHLRPFALSAFCREVSSPGLHGRLWYQISPHVSP